MNKRKGCIHLFFCTVVLSSLYFKMILSDFLGNLIYFIESSLSSFANLPSVVTTYIHSAVCLLLLMMEIERRPSDQHLLSIARNSDFKCCTKDSDRSEPPLQLQLTCIRATFIRLFQQVYYIYILLEHLSALRPSVLVPRFARCPSVTFCD